ncbi:MAG TPA: ABC transporter permease [Rhizomicrobium sp.]|nr:ABC transporter permease [Rhizomicrobium sp.]
MFRNYLVSALRNIARHKLYSFINIAGFALGLACAIFIILFVRDELSYDAWIPDSGNIYRLEETIQVPGRGPLPLAVTPYPMAAAMRDEIPGVVDMTRFWEQPMTLTVGDRQFFEGVRTVDPDFFRMIRLPLVEGDPATVFRQPNSVVMSGKAVRKYFGDADPIGRTVTTGRGGCPDADTACQSQIVTLTVAGVMRDLPHNTQLDGDVFIPSTSQANRISPDARTDWDSQNGWSFVKLAPGTDPKAVVAAMVPMLDRNLGTLLGKIGVHGQAHDFYSIHLTPFSRVHLNSEQWRYNATTPGSWTTIYGVGAIGVLILLVACFNFMNLATARASLRAREISLRKTLGATRRQLIVQFLGESLLMAMIALLLALALVEVLLPVFGAFLHKPIQLHYLSDWPVLLLILAITVVAGLVSGSYPALVLSGFRPANVLRTTISGQTGSGRFRTALVVAQFAVSIGLGIAALVVFSQISYARNLNMGFRHDNIVIIESGKMTLRGQESFLQRLRGYPGILAVGLSNMSPLDQGQSEANVRLPGQPEMIMLDKLGINPDFARVYGIRLVAGRMLSDQRADDSFKGLPFAGNPANEGHNILVNETAARRLGFTPQSIVGKTLIYTGSHVTVVGVLSDIKFGGAREPVKPTTYIYDPTFPASAAVLVRGDMIPQTLAFIDRAWHEYAPIAAIRRRFLDDTFARLYQADQRQGVMFGAFVAVAILIACLGLFGLAAFTASRRTREIGIRKVFGARDGDVVRLLLWQFSLPVLAANLIAWPLAWYYLHGWLQNFAFRIALNPLYFLAVGAVALLIAWTTILSHALRVARANPIHALRTE